MNASPFTDHDASYWIRGALWGLATLALAFGLRMLEWSCWQDPEFRLGSEMLLATHDAYHWVAGAEGFSFGVGHPMSELLRIMAEALGTYPAAVAFWFPAALSSLVALIVFAWVWALGSMEAGVAAGLLTSLSPGFLARTLLGYYDTDLVTLFFPLLMTLAPACWAMRYMLLPHLILRRLMLSSGLGAARRLWGGEANHELKFGNPLRWQWMLLLGLSGVVSWWAQEWHSVFPYLIRYNILLLGGLCVVLAQRGRRSLLLLGSLAYALPVPKLKLSAGALRVMHRVRTVVLALLLLALWLGFGASLLDYEPFTAFLFTTAAPAVLVLAAAFVVLAVFVPAPWCHALCPMGELLNLAEPSKKQKK